MDDPQQKSLHVDPEIGDALLEIIARSNPAIDSESLRIALFVYDANHSPCIIQNQTEEEHLNMMKWISDSYHMIMAKRERVNATVN